MAAYYNEFDTFAAAWLRELIAKELIPEGDVDERDIRNVHPDDLRGYKQCHFFAGIGGWAYALRLARWPDDRPVWTGSPPCQPFSTAGKRLGVNDDRHLAPVWLRLVEAVRPAVLFGEQVAAAVTKDAWLDDLLNALEEAGYATGAAVIPACSVGAPHIRQRLWFVAERLADADGTRLQGRYRVFKRANQQPLEQRSMVSGMAVSDSRGPSKGHKTAKVARHRHSVNTASSADRPGSTNEAYGFWDDADWLRCKDGKWRPVESGSFPLADGVSARVGRLRGYGNAIVPQVAAEVIRCFMEEK